VSLTSTTLLNSRADSYGSNLTLAIQKSEDFRVKMAQFPPVTSGKHRETKSFAAIMDETLGFMD
jgi:beta-1,4-N-acetylglucosaminyltransferase